MEGLAEMREAVPGIDSAGGERVLVDTHVHLHRAFGAEDALDRAADNLRLAAPRRGIDATPLGVLVLTEATGVDAFGRLAEPRPRALDRWEVEPTADGCSLYARCGPSELLLVSGRQVATRDGLEVLALATRTRLEDGMPLEETVRQVEAAGAVPVIPWGFGKWWLARGRKLAELVDRRGRGEILLGDNGARPRLAPAPALFARAEARGIAVLAGSDPLPFPDQVSRVGSYGSVLEVRLGRERPADRLREYLLGLRDTPPTFGGRMRLTGFISSQVRMQMLVRSRRA